MMDPPDQHPPEPPADAGAGTPAQASYPSPLKRLFARLIDWAIHFVLILIVLVVLATTSFGDELSWRAQLLVFFGVTALLRGVFEVGFVGAMGATPGKLALGLKIRQSPDVGQPVTWAAATKRAVVIDVPTLFGGLYYVILLAASNLDDTLVALLTIAWVAAWVLWLVAVLSIFANDERRGIHDRMCNTAVVQT